MAKRKGVGRAKDAAVDPAHVPSEARSVELRRTSAVDGSTLLAL